MKIFDEIKEIKEPETAVCIGKFDGFHKGHRLLLRKAMETELPVVLLTFHMPDQKSIDSPDEKRSEARALCADYYIEPKDTKELFSMSPEEFLERVVLNLFHAKHVIVGEDFCFGKGRAGNIDTLKTYSEEHDHVFELSVIEKLREGDAEISSTRIRESLAEGKMEEVSALLGRSYRIDGRVIDGRKLGRKIGIPTANIFPDEEKLLPPHGVYAVTAEWVEGSEIVKYEGIANLGVKPTVSEVQGDDEAGSGNPVGLEVNLFSYRGDLYDKSISVRLLSFIREERRFENMQELRFQIDEDIRAVKGMNIF